MRQGLSAAQTGSPEQNLIWSRYSNDKPDIAQGTMRAFHMLAFAHNDSKPINILSIGCGIEPQLRLLNAISHNIITLLDNDPAALANINERISRQFYHNIHTISEDYEAFLDVKITRNFLKMQLNNQKADAIFFHHSLYYLPMRQWTTLITNIYNELLANNGVIHCVLMSRYSDNQHTTTWLYNNYTRSFFNHTNEQSLLAFKEMLIQGNCLKNAELNNHTSEIKFWVNTFECFMQVIWMILLYPKVHLYNKGQMEIIIKDIYDNFFVPQQPLLQTQDHLYIQKLITD